MSSLISAILPQFFLIVSRTVLRGLKSFPASFWSGLEAMVYYVLFPPFLFLSVYRAKFSFESSARFLAIAIGCMFSAMILSWLINQFYEESAWTKWSVFHCGFRFNTYIGFALCQPLLGNEGLALLSLLIAIWVPISNTVAVITLSYASESRSKFCLSGLIKTVVKNPLILATLSGLFCNVLAIPVPNLLLTLLNHLGGSALSLGLLCIGAGLTFGDFKKYKKLIALCSIERLILVPLAAFVVAVILLSNPLEACVLILFAALPTAQSCYVMTSKMNGNGSAVADLSSAQTLFSIVTLSFWAALMTKVFLS